MSQAAIPGIRPWEEPFWKPAPGKAGILFYIVTHFFLISYEFIFKGAVRSCQYLHREQSGIFVGIGSGSRRGRESKKMPRAPLDNLWQGAPLVFRLI